MFPSYLRKVPTSQEHRYDGDKAAALDLNVDYVCKNAAERCLSSDY